jgi:hypothetical protein
MDNRSTDKVFDTKLYDRLINGFGRQKYWFWSTNTVFDRQNLLQKINSIFTKENVLENSPEYDFFYEK